MFSRDLGIQIVQISEKRVVIGKLALNEATGCLKIINPLAITSNSTKKTTTKETYKLHLESISEYSNGHSMIVHKWNEIQMPRKSLKNEYLRILSEVLQPTDDYYKMDSLDMDSILRNEETETQENPNKNKKDTSIHDRWLDKPN